MILRCLGRKNNHHRTKQLVCYKLNGHSRVLRGDPLESKVIMNWAIK